MGTIFILGVFGLMFSPLVWGALDGMCGDPERPLPPKIDGGPKGGHVASVRVRR